MSSYETFSATRAAGRSGGRDGRRGRESRGRKGSLGLIFMLVLWVAFFLFLFILQFIHLNKVVGFKVDVDVFMDLNDRGTELYTLLSSGGGESNMMALGSYGAKNAPASLESHLKDSLNAMSSAKGGGSYYLGLSDGTLLLKSWGAKPESLPGSVSTLASSFGTSLESAIRLDWPVKDYGAISNGYGWRTLAGKQDSHGGLDFAVGEGTGVYSAYPSGRVARVGTGCQPSPDVCRDVASCAASADPACCCNGGLGNFVTLEHTSPEGERFYTFYCHLKDVLVKGGDVIGTDIQAGNRIATSGKTGYVKGVTGEHLHFELGTSSLKRDETSVDPCGYLAAPVPSTCEEGSRKTVVKQSGGAYAEVPTPDGGKARVELII